MNTQAPFSHPAADPFACSGDQCVFDGEQEGMWRKKMLWILGFKFTHEIAGGLHLHRTHAAVAGLLAPTFGE